MVYDYVIVGGGSAGCVAAGRLAREEGARVMLLEGGGMDDSLLVRAPAGLVKLMKPGSRYYQEYVSAPQPQLGGRTVPILQPWVLGGGSTVNAMTYTRGTRADYDAWDRDLGGAGWSWEELLPHFMRQESNQRLGAPFHGTRGALRVSDPHHPISDASRAFLLAMQASGVPFTSDFNAGDTRGVGIIQSTTYRGERWSAARAFLPRAGDSTTGLEVRLHARAARVVVEAGKVAGVEFFTDGRNRSLEIVRARNVILAAGCFGSAHLLMLSGIGDAVRLQDHGIRCVADLPGVGRGIQDHNDTRLGFETWSNAGYSRQDRGWRMLWNGLQYLAARSGPATSTGSEVTAFTNPLDASAEPTLQFYCLGRLAPSAGPSAVGITLAANLIAPHSRGMLSLRSADPRDLPVIDPAWLTDERDEEQLIAGVEFLLDIANTAPLKELVRRCNSFDGIPDRAAVARHVRAATGTNWHPVGSCRMGREGDPMAVVDTQLRVRGVEGLRVVDASVMPRIIGANTNAPVMAIADRAVDFMLGKAVVPAAALDDRMVV